MLTATFSASEVNAVSESARKARDKQALVHQYSAIGLVENELREIATLRLYMSASASASRVTAILFVNAYPVSISASGSASGYGYHKGSSAAADAIANAGIALSENIFGVGNEAIREAMEAIALAAVPSVRYLKIFEANN